jgi:hypothetical protein
MMSQAKPNHGGRDIGARARYPRKSRNHGVLVRALNLIGVTSFSW